MSKHRFVIEVTSAEDLNTADLATELDEILTRGNPRRYSTYFTLRRALSDGRRGPAPLNPRPGAP